MVRPSVPEPALENARTGLPSTSDQPQSKLALTAGVAKDEVLDPRCQVFISKIDAATDFVSDIVRNVLCPMLSYVERHDALRTLYCPDIKSAMTVSW
jgi:hypothetical protein